MGEKAAVRTREKWVDDVKVIACILVVLGHFFQSMTKANILPENDLYKWFNTTIYYFHVPLFFICSGYLYQKYSRVNSVGSWIGNCNSCKRPDFDWGGYCVYAVSTVLSNEIWFVLGMSICAFNVQLKGKTVQGTASGLLFIFLSVAVYRGTIQSNAISFMMGMLACVTVVILSASCERKFGRLMDFVAKYTMPIFLMHTLFAAPVRSILMKVGTENAAVHVVLGLGISFAGPIIAAWIMKKTKWLEFFLYPIARLKNK